MKIVRSLFYFVLAGLCEIDSGYLMGLWLRQGKSLVFGVSDAMLLTLYGIIPTLQPASFSRVYAAYGGIFILVGLACRSRHTR